MNITIIGAGAVGRLWGCKLADKHTVHFWTRDNSQQLAVQLSGSEATNPITSQGEFQFEANQTALLADSELVLVTVKAFQVEKAIQAVKANLKPGSIIVIMHNGMGSQQTVRALLPDHPIVYATTAQAAFRPYPE